MDPALGDGVQRQPNAGGVRDWIPVWQERKKFQRHRKERSLASNQTPPQAASVLISEVRTVHIKAEQRPLYPALELPSATQRFRQRNRQRRDEVGFGRGIGCAECYAYWIHGLKRNGPSPRGVRVGGGGVKKEGVGA